MRDIMKKLMKLDGAVVADYNPYLQTIQCQSPSVNWTFGKGHGLPLGYCLALFGEPKAGKSLIAYSMIGWLHQNDPDAIAVRFDTEFRTQVQLTDAQAAAFNIDRNRLLNIEVNSATGVFDQIEQEINALCQDKNADGKIKLIIIDSINGIVGRRMENAKSVGQQLIGDNAQTLGDGFKRILPVIRRNKIALVITAQARAEMDEWERKRNGHDIKMAASFQTKHFAEYFMLVSEIKGKDGRTDMLDKELIDTNVKDFMDKGEKTGHRVRIKMVAQSMGGSRERVGEFTIDYKRGITNTHEEIFVLGTGRNIIDRPNNRTYRFGDKQWDGKEAMLEALKNDTALQNEIMKEIYRQDLNLED